MPRMTLSPDFLGRKCSCFSLCQNIFVLIGRVGEWLNWLPVDHNIVFVATDLGWIDMYPKLKRLKDTFYFGTGNNSIDSVITEVYHRSLFDDALEMLPPADITIKTYVGRKEVKLDYNNLDFRAVAFTFAPYTVLNNDNTDHDGYEFNIANEVARALKLNLIVKTPTTGFMWGVSDGNGSYTGTINTGLLNGLDLKIAFIFVLENAFKQV